MRKNQALISPFWSGLETPDKSGNPCFSILNEYNAWYSIRTFLSTIAHTLYTFLQLLSKNCNLKFFSSDYLGCRFHFCISRQVTVTEGTRHMNATRIQYSEKCAPNRQVSCYSEGGKARVRQSRQVLSSNIRFIVHQ